MQVLLQVISLSYPQQCLKFQMLQHILTTLLFSFTNLSQGDFLYYPNFFILKFILPVLLLNLNKTCCTALFLASFVKLLNVRLDECSLFFSHLTSGFFHCNREGAKLNQCFSPGGSLVNYFVQLQISSGANPDLIVD